MPHSRIRLAALLALALTLAFAGGAALAQGGPAVPSTLKPGDAFGDTVTLPDLKIVFLKGHTNWDTAFDTLTDAFKSLKEYLDK